MLLKAEPMLILDATLQSLLGVNACQVIAIGFLLME